jgi:hypothetical protein
MSRARIALAATSVVAGFAGAALVLELADDASSSSGGGGGGATRTAVHTQVPARRPPVTLVSHRSRCLIDRRDGVVTFRITLGNSSAQDRATRVHPWVGFTNGGEIQETSYDRQIGVPAAGSRELEIIVPFEPRIYTPNRCRVYLDAARYTAIVMRRVS